MRKTLLPLLLCLILSVTWFPASASTMGHAEGTAIVAKAKEYIGKVPYVWGGNEIDGDNPGADCSGFVCAIFEKFGYNLWDNRTTLRNCGTNLGTDLDNAMPGDIIWYSGHVAIYAGEENGVPMIVHETGGMHDDVMLAKESVITAQRLGIIHIPGVSHNGKEHSTTSVQTSIEFTEATNPKYTSMASVTDTNAVLVSLCTKPAGTAVTHLGLYLYDSNGNLILKHKQPEKTVGASLTSFHCWWDLNNEVGYTLTPGTTYQYAFFGVFDGEEVEGPMKTFTTSGSADEETCTVTFHPNKGTIHGDDTVSASRSTIFGSITPSIERDGYELDGWYTKASGGTPVPDSAVLTSDLDVYAHWTEVEEEEEDPLTFSDVDPDSWYADAVAWAVKNKITSGTGDNQFSPNRECTRAEIVTFLWNAMGSPKPDRSSSPFTDVRKGSYYYDAVLWALEENISSGTDSDTFSTGKPCSRAEAITFLYRAENSPSYAHRSRFDDVPSGSWYADAVSWGVSNQILQGTGDNCFSPDGTCTRAQIVTMLYRYFG